MYNNKTILITGGTGSFGQSFAKYLLINFRPKKVIIFSRDELKQFNMQQELGEHDNIRFFLGDIRDVARLRMAFEGVDIVVHAAALKQVPALEYNPFEAIQTNILGSQNIITAALERKVGKVLLISTDKAASPVNLYGASKMCAEKLFVSSNVYSSDGETHFSVVRYGNVIGSRGSIVDTIMNNKSDAPLHVTDHNMTRFWITLNQCFDLVSYALKNMVGGEIFIPKVPSMKIQDLFKALAPDRKIKIIGIRPGEKIHETLITQEESSRAHDLEDYYVILPHTKSLAHHSKYDDKKSVKKNFVYTSDLNRKWLTSEQIKKIAGLV
ncbi:MAG: UDP-N-acetylglucosamine 4,6-dehydratase (inverting) [Candidatus Paceibacterota bacterium]|jgi:UDP-N-acetylglucosamine 4,6-dehydratase